jgi:hypothetical protein
MSNKPYVGQRTPDFADDTTGDVGFMPGIYVGTIVSQETATRDGRLDVYIAQFGGAEGTKNATVTYASPYLGSTTSPPGEPQFNRYFYTKQTYGFFMTPPDVGNQVLCCFPPGKGAVGFWFACITSNASLYMLPASGALSLDKIDPASFSDALGQQLLPFLKAGNFYPVGEFNENQRNVWTPNWINNLRPINGPLALQFIQQGLDSDPTRGAITSSVQRDPISAVLGFNSPGRPIPSQDPKNNANLRQKIASGNFTPSEFVVTTRLTGHSLVLDDGDIYGQNNLVRMRTAAGHQVMMNDSEGFVYISNAAGTAWVELTKTGDVLIYGRNDFSVRTQGNIMFHSDRNLSINARNINMRATSAISLEGQAIQATGERIVNFYGRTVQLKSASNMGLFAGSSMAIRASGSMALNASIINLNGGGGGGEIAQPQKLPSYLSSDSFFTESGWTVATNSIDSICYRIPTHEPYIRGNIASIIQNQEIQANVITNYTGTVTTIDGEIVVPPVLLPSENQAGASNIPVTDPAPSSQFIKQTDPGIDVGVLNNDQFRAYLAQIGYTSSGGDYNPVFLDSPVQGLNPVGAAGKYQLDSFALQAVGFVKPGTPQSIEAINNPNNWVGPPAGPANLQAFLANPDIQDQAVIDYTRYNYSELQKAGIITPNSTSQEIAGYLATSHVGTAAATEAWYTNIDTQNLDTKTLDNYYQQGRYSQTRVSVIQRSNASKVIING